MQGPYSAHSNTEIVMRAPMHTQCSKRGKTAACPRAPLSGACI